MPDWKKLIEVNRDEILRSLKLAAKTSIDSHIICSLYIYSDGKLLVFDDTSGRKRPSEDCFLIYTFDYRNFQISDYCNDNDYVLLKDMRKAMSDEQRISFDKFMRYVYNHCVFETLEWIISNAPEAYRKVRAYAISQKISHIDFDGIVNAAFLKI